MSERHTVFRGNIGINEFCVMGLNAAQAKGEGWGGMILILFHWDWAVEIGISYDPKFGPGFSKGCHDLAKRWDERPEEIIEIQKMTIRRMFADQIVSMVNAKLRGAVQIIIKGNGTILAFMTDTPEFEGLLSWTLHGIADSLAAGGKN